MFPKGDSKIDSLGIHIREPLRPRCPQSVEYREQVDDLLCQRSRDGWEQSERGEAHANHAQRDASECALKCDMPHAFADVNQLIELEQ